MTIRTYRDFVVAAEFGEEAAVERDYVTVRVFSSPAGEMQPVHCSILPRIYEDALRLQKRNLSPMEIQQLGAILADVLLPGRARELLARCLDGLDAEEGLRLRLRLGPGLSELPWEYLYVPLTDTADDVTGFLALDPRISIVRHEALPIRGKISSVPSHRRLVVVLANPVGGDFPRLDLEREKTQLEAALQGLSGISADFLENPTSKKLSDELLSGADIFHFAGHGTFDDRDASSEGGQGAIVLVTGEGAAAPMPAEQLAVNLRGRNVQLVVLSACATAQHSGDNVWGSVAAAMLKAGIPAAVAMQHALWDESALAFSRSFYRTLAAGMPLDQAVSAGRLAIFNLCHPLRNEPDGVVLWPDWGNPVLYLRTQEDFILEMKPATCQNRKSQSTLPTTEVRAEPLPPYQTRDLEEVANRLNSGRLTLFLGDELSEEIAGLPPKQAIADRLARREDIAPGPQLATIAQQVMRNGSRYDFTDFLIQTLGPAELAAGPFYQEVARLVAVAQPESIITTAYHNLLELALQRRGIAINVIVRDESLRFVDSSRVTVLKLFGDVQQVDTLVVTEQDQNALLRGRDKPDMLDEVRRSFRRTSMLFLGYDLRDAAISALFDEIAGQRFQVRSYVAWPAATERERASFEQNRGLKVLNMDPMAVVQALVGLLEKS